MTSTDDDQAEEVGSAHVRDEEAEGRRSAHMRSIPSMINNRTANMAIPITMATASMGPLCNAIHHARMTIHLQRITIS